MSNYLEKYNKEIVPSLKTELGYKHDLAVPRLNKIVLNIGAGESLVNDKEKEEVLAHLGAISGQKPAVTVAKKAIAGFKIRQGQPVGARVTLRGKRMYDFLEKLISVVLPRVRDFRGVSTTSFDKQGGYSIGFREQMVFPEIDVSKLTKYRGLQITISTTGKNGNETRKLLELFGMPFRKEN